MNKKLKIFGVRQQVADPETVKLFLESLLTDPPKYGTQLEKRKRAFSKIHEIAPIQNRDLTVVAKKYGIKLPKPLFNLIQKRAVRTVSGVSPIGILTKPYPCPGRCVYCPTEDRMPKSYMSNQPAAARALRNNFHPHKQVKNRIIALEESGHPVSKLEVIVMGGTWSFLPHKYQSWYVKKVFDAANGEEEVVRKKSQVSSLPLSPRLQRTGKSQEENTGSTSPLAGGIKGGSLKTAPLIKGEASNLSKKQAAGGFIKKDKKSKILNQVQDDKNKTLAHFNFGPHRLFPVGRLDKDSHGLLLMTNDGDLAFRLTHPKFEHEKEYIVVVNKKIDQKVIHTLSNGVIEIDGKPVNPCLVEKLGPKVLRILLTEGRNRQIRRMCEVCELKVVELLRTRIENIKLGDIKEGQWKTVKKSEYKVLREKVFCN